MALDKKVTICVVVYLIAFALAIAAMTVPIASIDAKGLGAIGDFGGINLSGDIKMSTKDLKDLDVATGLYAFSILFVIALGIAFIMMFVNKTIYKYVGLALLLISIIAFALAAATIAKINDLNLNMGPGAILMLIASLLVAIVQITHLPGMRH